MLRENLLKARDSAEFARADAQAALHHANAVEALVLMRIIEHAAALANEIKALLSAIGEA